jgi:hypothetical protein
VNEPIGNQEVNYDDLDSMLLTMDLRTLGELAFDIVNSFCSHRNLEHPATHDDEGHLTKDARVIAGSAWKSVLRMNDRREFAASVTRDLEQLA